MTFQLIYPTRGRGAWTNLGGTLDSEGDGPGIYYRSPAGSMLMPGIVGYRAVRNATSVDINSYAVYMAVKGIQREVGTTEDGLYGSDTAAAVQRWQAGHNLLPDGVFGPASARVMFRERATTAAKAASDNSAVVKLTLGHIGFESSWDPGAVGYVQPQDLGLGQINGPAHPGLSVDFRLTARSALSFVADFVLGNLEAMFWNERDAIVAYNLGIGGARAWVKAGRPASYLGTDVAGYISGVLAAVN